MPLLLICAVAICHYAFALPILIRRHACIIDMLTALLCYMIHAPRAAAIYYAFIYAAAMLMPPAMLLLRYADALSMPLLR